MRLLFREVSESDVAKRADVIAVRVNESVFVLEMEVNGRFEPIPVQYIGEDNDGSI